MRLQCVCKRAAGRRRDVTSCVCVHTQEWKHDGPGRAAPAFAGGVPVVAENEGSYYSLAKQYEHKLGVDGLHFTAYNMCHGPFGRAPCTLQARRVAASVAGTV